MVGLVSLAKARLTLKLSTYGAKALLVVSLFYLFLLLALLWAEPTTPLFFILGCCFICFCYQLRLWPFFSIFVGSFFLLAPTAFCFIFFGTSGAIKKLLFKPRRGLNKNK
jgi:hypothetical protein